MKNDESVLVNDLKALGEEVKDKDFSHKFLRCLPSRFCMLVTLLVRSSLDTMTPNQVLGDVITDDTYRDDDEKEEKKNEKMTRRRVWHSKPHHSRARPSKTHLVKMNAQALMRLMMRRWIFL
jgi:hypothetical protein